MNWTQTDVTEEHQAASGRYNVVRALEGGIPWIEETAEVYYKEERPLDVLEQFIVRCLVELEPVEDATEISEILGFGDDRFVTPTVEELDRMELVKTDDQGYHATEELEEANEEGVWVNQYTHTVTCACNPFTGRRFDGRPTYLDEGGNIKVEELPSSELGQEAFEEWAVGDVGPLHGAEITRVDFHDRTVLWQPFHLIVLEDHHEDTWGWEPYDPIEGEVVASYRSACKFLEATKVAHDLLSKRSSEDDAVVVPSGSDEGRSIQVEDISDRTIAKKEFVRRYGTREAAARINEAIAGAQKEVLVSFPWIKGPALTSNLLEAFTEALERGVFLYVGYGINQSVEDEDSHPDAIERLRALDQNTEGTSRVVWTGASHVKEVVIDRNEYLGGSFNRLSFRGDPDRETGIVRRESMIHTNSSGVVEDNLEEFLPILRTALFEQTSFHGGAEIQRQSRLRTELLEQTSHKQATSYAEWRDAWRPLFRLDPTPNQIRTALEALPNTGRKQVSAAREVLSAFQGETDVQAEAVLSAVIQALEPRNMDVSDSGMEEFWNVIEEFGHEHEVNNGNP
jgi:hypothetical protein